MGFNKKDGDYGELLVCNLYDTQQWYSDIVDMQTPFYKLYDIKTTTAFAEFTTEVKYDKYQAKSGNIAIEIYNPKSDTESGLTSTRANFWAHVLIPGVIYLITVSSLLDFAATQIPHRIIGCGGDNNSCMLLYKDAIILPSFTQIDEYNVNNTIRGLLNV